MLILISKFDPLLKHHIDDAVMKSEKVCKKCNSGSASVGRPGNLLTMLSKTTADYIIESIGQLIRKTIVDDINKALFFTIQIDSTQNVNVHDQLCVIIRYVTDSVNERLLAFIKCTSGTGQDLCLLVRRLLENSGIDIKKCIGSSTDSASNMRGEYKGFSAWLKKEVPEALHVWCHAHVLNLVMTDVTKMCVDGIIFFGLLNAIAVFVRESYLIVIHKYHSVIL
ncbi:hypothetical protein AGLY_008837 [Aphis glycines]|uniref:DUF4371 domain-containing protein n=1 Tax=Aphis glycines TaxID=307491 RepID=A0A6G0TLY8_APHGL|nr:hypothetical protein AGLY_008837 [Aphis glycines]